MSDSVTPFDVPDEGDLTDDSLIPVVRRTIEPATVDGPALESVQRRATVPWYKKLYYLVRGYAIEDFQVLHDAGIRGVVGKAEQQVALATKDYAEADLDRAQAEKTRAEAAKLRAEAEETEANAALKFALAEHTRRQAAKARNAGLLKSDSSPQRQASLDSEAENESVQEAVEKLLTAIAVIRTKGGEVYLSKEQILEALQGLGEDLDE